MTKPHLRPSRGPSYTLMSSSPNHSMLNCIKCVSSSFLNVKLYFAFVSLVCDHPHCCSIYLLSPVLIILDCTRHLAFHHYDPNFLSQPPKSKARLTNTDVCSPTFPMTPKLPAPGKNFHFIQLMRLQGNYNPLLAPPLVPYRRSPSSPPLPIHFLPQWALCFVLPASLLV